MSEKKNDVTFETPEDLEEFMAEKPSKGVDEDVETFEGDKHRDFSPAKSGGEGAAFSDTSDDEKQGDILNIAGDVPVQVVAVLGKKNITMREMASMRMGEVIELGRPANEIVDLVAGGKLVAKGELVEIEGKLGVRIIKVMR